MERNKLYIFIGAVALLSYVWLFLNHDNMQWGGCFFKTVTSLACPACGTTTSVLALSEGKLQQAVLINPLGLLASVLLIVMPIWLIIDLCLGKSSIYSCYIKSEELIKNKYIAGSLIILSLINWAWNITKNL